jgi:hypothetical protein
MRSRKQSDSPSDYDREIRPRKKVEALRLHENAIRNRERRACARACASTDMRPADDWPGCVD